MSQGSSTHGQKVNLIYCRFSSKEQEGNFSIETQERVVRDFISPRWPGEQIEVIADRAKSGTMTAGRDGLAELLRRVNAGGVARVCVYKFDRLGRNVEETESVANQLKKAGVELWSALEGQNPLVRQILGAVAEDYSRQLATRTRDGLHQLALDGFPTGGPAPYGYVCYKVADPKGRRDKTGQLVQRTAYKIDCAEAPTVRWIFEQYASGQGIKTIAQDLNGRGIQAPRGNGRGWDPSAIRAILTNETYRGLAIFNRRYFVKTKNGKRTFRWNDRSKWVITESPHVPRIIPDELWGKVQARFKTQLRDSPKGPPRRYPLSGLVTCASCGARCQTVSSTGKGHVYRYLQCAHAYRRGPAICSNHARVHADPLAERIVDTIERNLFSPQNIQYLISKVRENVRALLSGTSDQRGVLERRLADVQKRIDGLLNVLEEGGKEIPDLLERLKDRTGEREAIEAQLASLGRARSCDPLAGIEKEVMSRLGKTVQMLNESTVEIFRDELRKHVKAAELHKDGRVRLVGTLEGLLQGAPEFVQIGSGGLIPESRTPLPRLVFWRVVA